LSENSDIVHALDQIAGVKFMGINARELIGLSLILAADTLHLREALRFIGVSDVRFALIGPTVGRGEQARLAREAAHRQLVEMAASF
jgi:hypothetical protein